MDSRSCFAIVLVLRADKNSASTAITQDARTGMANSWYYYENACNA